MNVRSFSQTLARLSSPGPPPAKAPIPRISQAEVCASLAREFTRAQSRPAAASAFNPTPEQLAAILSRAPSKHPERARQALAIYDAMRDGRLTVVEDD